MILLAAGAFATTGALTVAANGASAVVALGNGETWTNTGSIADAGLILVNYGQGTTTATLSNSGTIALTADSGAIHVNGAAALTNAGLIVKSGGTGTSSLMSLTNTGTIEAARGTLALSGISGTGTLRIDAGATLEAQFIAGTQTAAFNGAGGTLKLDRSVSLPHLAGLGGGDRIDLVGTTVKSAVVAGATLTVTTASGTLTYVNATSLAGLSVTQASDGAGGTLIGVVRQATASRTPEPVAFGSHHVKDVVTQALTVTNTAAGDGYSEALDGSLSTTATGFTATGAFIGLGAGKADGTDLNVTLSTATAGVVTGTATLALSSDGTGIDTAGTTALAPQVVSVSGTVDAYAAPALSAATLNLGIARIGGTFGGSVTLANGAVASAYQEGLGYAATGPAALTVGNAAGTLAGGGAVTLAVGGTTAGDFTGTTLTLSGTSVALAGSGLSSTVLSAQTVALSGKLYATAVTALGTTSLNAGVVHVADTVVLTDAVTNTAAGGLVDQLTGGTATQSATGVTFAGLSGALAAGASGTVSFTLATATAGTVATTATLGFSSHDADLSDAAVAGGTVTVTGTVDNYATLNVTTAGTSEVVTRAANGSLTIDLGTAQQGAAALAGNFDVVNAGLVLADALGGTIALLGAATAAFTSAHTGAYSGLGAGGAATATTIALSTATAGVFTETFVVSGSGSNASGYADQVAQTQTITVRGTISGGGTTTTLAVGPNTITGGPGNNTLIASAAALNSRDVIDGGPGTNLLQLTGTGQFDLGAPKQLLDIASTTVAESAGAVTTVYLRDGLNTNLTVAGVTGGRILIYGAAATGTIQLGSGSDTVVLEGTSEAVAGGGGTALIQSTAAFAGSLVTGTSAGTTTLEITNGGAATLAGGDSNLFVKLDLATNLNLGAATFVTATGSRGADIITAGATGQTIAGGGGADTLVGFGGFGTTFRDMAANLRAATIVNFGGNDRIDLTDLAGVKLGAVTTTAGVTRVTLGATSVSLAGSFTAANLVVGSDGNSGTLLTYAAAAPAVLHH